MGAAHSTALERDPTPAPQPVEASSDAAALASFLSAARAEAATRAPARASRRSTFALKNVCTLHNVRLETVAGEDAGAKGALGLPYTHLVRFQVELEVPSVVHTLFGYRLLSERGAGPWRPRWARVTLAGGSGRPQTRGGGYALAPLRLAAGRHALALPLDARRVPAAILDPHLPTPLERVCAQPACRPTGISIWVQPLYDDEDDEDCPAGPTEPGELTTATRHASVGASRTASPADEAHERRTSDLGTAPRIQGNIWFLGVVAEGEQTSFDRVAQQDEFYTQHSCVPEVPSHVIGEAIAVCESVSAVASGPSAQRPSHGLSSQGPPSGVPSQTIPSEITSSVPHVDTLPIVSAFEYAAARRALPHVSRVKWDEPPRLALAEVWPALLLGDALRNVEAVFTNDTCVVCLAAPPRSTLLPCRHVALCATCAQQTYRTCPICRQTVTVLLQTDFE